jgi:hypothetical protein
LKKNHQGSILRGEDHCIKFSILEDQKLPEAAPGLSPFQISLEIMGSHEQNQLLESAIRLIPEFRDSLSSAFPLSFFFCFYQPQKVILVRPLALAQSTQHFEEIFRDLSPRGDKGGPLFAQVTEPGELSINNQFRFYHWAQKLGAPGRSIPGLSLSDVIAAVRGRTVELQLRRIQMEVLRNRREDIEKRGGLLPKRLGEHYFGLKEMELAKRQERDITQIFSGFESVSLKEAMKFIPLPNYIGKHLLSGENEGAHAVKRSSIERLESARKWSAKPMQIAVSHLLSTPEEVLSSLIPFYFKKINTKYKKILKAFSFF